MKQLSNAITATLTKLNSTPLIRTNLQNDINSCLMCSIKIVKVIKLRRIKLVRYVGCLGGKDITNNMIGKVQKKAQISKVILKWKDYIKECNY